MNGKTVVRGDVAEQAVAGQQDAGVDLGGDIAKAIVGGQGGMEL